MLKSDSVIPLYQQIADDIKQKIETGEYKSGQMIPSETKLCELYEVSRITVRNAISSLVEEDILIKRHGKGTFVQTVKMQLDNMNFSGFTSEWNRQNISSYSRVLQLEKVAASDKIAQKLQVTSGAPVVYLKRQRFADGKALVLEHVYLPYEKYAFLLTMDMNGKSLYQVIGDKTGLNPEHTCSSTTVMEVNNATPDEASLLDLGDRDVVFVMSEIVKTPADEVVHYTKQIVSGGYIQYTMVNRSRFLSIGLQN